MHSIVWLIKELKEDCEETTSLQRQQMLNHGYQKPYIMTTSFREEMSCQRAAICDTTVALELHLGAMVNRAHTWDIAGDSCKGSGSGGVLPFWSGSIMTARGR